MIGNYFAQLTGSKRNALAVLASSAIFLAGCSNMAGTAPSANSLSMAATLSGHVHGGVQPVVGAAVTLWYAGQSGPAIAAATTTTDTSGSFTFQNISSTTTPTATNQFACPTTGATNPLVYVESIGGNTLNDGSGSSNTAAAFIGIYDYCNNLNTPHSLFLSEVTTAATMVVAQQFFYPVYTPTSGPAVTDALVADGTGEEHIIVENAINTINLLANTATGQANTSTVINASPTGPIPAVSVTATPEPGKINLLANIIAACINNDSATATPCTTLFSNAVPQTPNVTADNPTSFPKAADTLQALYYMLTNPTDTPNGSTSSNLSSVFGIAGPGPFGPALANQPTDWTVAINYTSTSTCGSSNAAFIDSPLDISIDANDGVWIANANGNLSQLSDSSVPDTCVSLGTGGAQGGSVIDANGNAWYGAGTNVYQYNPNTRTSITMPVTGTVLGITADAVGNVFYSVANSLYELPGASTATSAVTPVQISTTVGSNPVRLMIDNQGTTGTSPNVIANPSNIFVSSGAGYFSKVSLGTGTGSVGGYITTQFPTTGTDSYGLTLNHINSVFVSDFTSGYVDQYELVSGSYQSAPTFPYITPANAGISGPTFITVDGRSNVWLPNNMTNSLSEISLAPRSLSSTTGFQKSSTYLNAGRAAIVDQAGNLWTVGNGNNFVTEVVGAAVPIFQPYTLGIIKGRFQTVP
jgi:hypothetical protein